MHKTIRSLGNISRLEVMAAGNSALHRLHPLGKLFVTIVFIVAVVSHGRYAVGALLPFFLYPAVLLPLSKTPFKPIFSRTLVALPFVLFTGISNLIFDREIAFILAGLPVSYGLLSFVSILLKTILTTSSVFLLIATTPLIDLSCELIRIKIPKVLVTQLVLIIRYISVLAGEAYRMITAYRLRGGAKQGIRIRDMGSFLGQLLLRSFDRADRVYSAMRSRGFQGDFRLRAPRPFRWQDGCFLVLSAGAVIGVRLAESAGIWGRLL